MMAQAARRTQVRRAAFSFFHFYQAPSFFFPHNLG